MRKENVRELKGRLLLAAVALVLAAMFGLLGSFVSHADSQGKITVRSAKIRKEPSTSSETVGGTKMDDVVNVISQVQGSDGYAWYQVTYGNLTGYIRSDLMKIVDNSTPPVEGGEPNVDVTPVNPTNATVTKDSGRIRSNASVNSQIVSEVPNGLVLTVDGKAEVEGTVWYHVTYNSADSQVEGFIRSDYVTVEGEMAPGTDTPPESTADPGQSQGSVGQEKEYDTMLQDGEWYVYNTATTTGYRVKDLLNSVEMANTNAQLYADLEKSEKNQKVIIIILIFLLVTAVAVIAFLVFKIRDMKDAAYFTEVENDTLRRKKAAAGQGQNQSGGQRVMHTVGANGQQIRSSGTGQGQRPQGMAQGQRMSGVSQGQRGMDAQSQRMTGSSQGQRMAGSSQGQRGMDAQGQRMAGMPQGQRGMDAQGQRMAGASQGQRGMDTQGQRRVGASQGQRPQGAVQGQRVAGSAQGQRMAGSSQGQRGMDTQGQRMAGTSQGQRPMGAPQSARPQEAQDRGGQQSGGWQAKNFMAEEDEFELEQFMNYDADEGQN